ncbi:MAG: hypothetical protein QW102_03220 [Candidatus Nezhaarchaeales archaeon]
MIFDTCLGQFEKNDEVIHASGRLAAPGPPVLEEFEKLAFRESSLRGLSGGAVERVGYIFLSWLSDEKRTAFITDTRNNINQIDQTFLRPVRSDRATLILYSDYGATLRCRNEH